MKAKYKPGQQVYFLICGRYVMSAIVVTASPWFVTIRFSKRAGECIIRLPYSRIFSTEEEARQTTGINIYNHSNCSNLKTPTYNIFRASTGLLIYSFIVLFTGFVYAIFLTIYKHLIRYVHFEPT